MALAGFKCLKCTGTNAATETDTLKVPAILSADNATTDIATFPIKAPLTVIDTPVRSMEMVLRWELTSMPDSYVQNFKIYGPTTQPDYQNSPANKLKVYWGTSTTGVTPVSTASTIATTTQHNNHYSVASALTIPITTANSKLDAIGEKTQYLYAQLEVYYGAQQGNMAVQMWSITFESV